MLAVDLPTLYHELDELGFYSYGTLTRQEILKLASICELSDENRARYRIEEALSAIVVALRYGEGLYEMPSWAQPYCLGFHAPDSVPLRVPRAPTMAGVPTMPDVPMVQIAHFARANWYAETLDRLKKLSQRLKKVLEGQAAASGEAVPPMRLWQRVANSGLPERPMALAAGLGSQGKNQLLIARRKNTIFASDTPLYSSAVVLGVLLCPITIRNGTVGSDIRSGISLDTEEESSETLNDKNVSSTLEKALAERGSYPLCGSCRKCVDACPSGALSLPLIRPDTKSKDAKSKVVFKKLLCIQHWTARLDAILPQEVEKTLPPRLYGCDSCLEVCPYFHPDPKADTQFGRLGPELPALYFVESSNETIRENFRGTTMNLAWMSMDAFRRNAALCLADNSD
ncbi:MAG TPA: 4Fe-4S double cluster binding domain-containing protein [Spirochaetales bacterium]|nr:4Fe-4S double cluster binding domain-containing protein [Spirochaetales bacterium]